MQYITHKPTTLDDKPTILDDKSFNVFTLQDLTGNDYQTVVDNVHGELVKELRGAVVVAILQLYNNKSSPVSIPDIKPRAKLFSTFTLQDGPQHNADYADKRAATREVQRVQGKIKTTREVQNLQGKVKGSQLTRECRKFLTMCTVNLSRNSGEM
jgi:hypothetical protein